MRYRVVCNCYFGGRYYEKGEVVAFADTEAVPSHFEAIDPKQTDVVADATVVAQKDTVPEVVEEVPEEPVKTAKPKRVTRKAGTAGK